MGAGVPSLAGIDEVGRGCLFGDVVAAAVILPEGLVLDGINDSKKLSEKKREGVGTRQIVDCAEAWAVSRVDSSVVDDINIKQAARLAMKQAVETLGVQPAYLLWMPRRWTSNCRSWPLSKEMRGASPSRRPPYSRSHADRLCRDEWDELYPAYGIAIHKGYATKLHREKLLEHGPSPMHRQSFLGKLFADQQVLF